MKRKPEYILIPGTGKRTIFVPVPSPKDDPHGWNYPYQGGDWPKESGWNWVWALRPGQRIDGYGVHADDAWWEDKQQRFFYFPDHDIYAWRPAEINYKREIDHEKK